jgi:general stress protein CsbA
MSKIYKYYYYLFAGSFLPFLITEFVVQDYFTFWFIIILAGVILTVCIYLEYLKVKYMQRLDVQNKKIDYLNWTQKKEKVGRAVFYYFKNRVR